MTDNKKSETKNKLSLSRPGKLELKKTIDWKPQYNNLNFILNTAIKWELKLKNEKIF